jgi:hypothetical protein
MSAYVAHAMQDESCFLQQFSFIQTPDRSRKPWFGLYNIRTAISSSPKNLHMDVFAAKMEVCGLRQIEINLKIHRCFALAASNQILCGVIFVGDTQATRHESQ